VSHRRGLALTQVYQAAIGFAPYSAGLRLGTLRDLSDTDFQGILEMRFRKSRASWRQAMRLKSEKGLRNCVEELISEKVPLFIVRVAESGPYNSSGGGICKLHTALRERRSVRSYEGTAVEEDKLTKVLEAARLAPSANNRQEWKSLWSGTRIHARDLQGCLRSVLHKSGSCGSRRVCYRKQGNS